MVTESFPADGKGGFGLGDWADYFGSNDGPMECYTSDALSLTLVDSGSICRLSAGDSNAGMSIDGYRLRIPAGATHDLPCPAPTSGTVTYYIVGYYDPLLNVAKDDDSADRPLGPCRFGLWSQADLTAAMAGKKYVLAYQITRAAGQALSAATVRSWMRWRGGPTIEWPTSMAIPPVGESLTPRGTLRFAMDSRKLLGRTITSSGGIGWVDILNAGPFPFPAPSSLVSRDAAPSTPQYLIHSGVMIKCRGTLKRANGKNLSDGNDVTLGTFPVGARPAFTERFICKVGPGKDYAEVRVAGGTGTDSGVVTLTGDAGLDWIDLSPITFRAEY